VAASNTIICDWMVVCMSVMHARPEVTFSFHHLVCLYVGSLLNWKGRTWANIELDGLQF
jgi:hypothetical protein